jgi:hypothetical protein
VEVAELVGVDGVRLIGSEAVCVFGKAITSRRDEALVRCITITMRSRPKAMALGEAWHVARRSVGARNSYSMIPQGRRLRF